METPVDERLLAEALLYGLRFCCADCAYFNTDSDCCSNDYPNHAHRDQRLSGRRLLVFCKSFELA